MKTIDLMEWLVNTLQKQQGIFLQLPYRSDRYYIQELSKLYRTYKQKGEIACRTIR